MSNTSVNGNLLLVANWESDVGYAWWLMENYWAVIATHLQQRNIDSILVYPDITTVPDTIAKTDIQVLQHAFNDTSIKGLLELKKIIKQYSIKHVYLTDFPSYHWLYALLKLWGIRNIIIHEHAPGTRVSPRGIKRYIKKILQRLPFITADHFIAVTSYVYDRFLTVTCIPEKKCYCVPNGIIPIDISSADRFHAQNMFSISRDHIVIVTTGRATYYKGIDFFIQCANEMINVKNHSNFHFLYCGDGPDIDDFKKSVAMYSLDEHFTFAGKRNDIREILPSCHIGLHCASGEVGYSLSILEYMSAGLVTIVPDNPSTSLATIDKVNGFIYKQGSVDSAVSAILASINENGSINEDIGKNAITYISNTKNIADTNDKLKTVFNSILNID